MDFQSERADLDKPELLLLLAGGDVSKGTLHVQFPKDGTVRFEAAGRDEDGAYLRQEDGSLMRLVVDDECFNDILAKDEIFIHQHDFMGNSFGDEYAITVDPLESQPGFSA